MGVQLNIKDPETVRLARELADATGRSVTDSIRGALEQAIAEQEADVQRRIAEVDRIVAEVRRKMPDELRGISSKELMDSIYDDGLPA